MALYVRGDNDREEVTRQMQEVLNFEKKMANVSIISLPDFCLTIEILHGAGSETYCQHIWCPISDY